MPADQTTFRIQIVIHSGQKFLPTDSLFFELIWQKLTDTDTDL